MDHVVEKQQVAKNDRPRASARARFGAIFSKLAWATKALVIAVFLGALGLTSASAANCPGPPLVTLHNGDVADATPVNSNFGALLDCANNNLAKNGANSDITSLSGITTPITVPQGGTNLSAVSANQVLVGTAANTYSVVTLPNCTATGAQHLNYDSSTHTFSCGVGGPSLRVQKFTSSGTFTIPTSATTSTVFEFLVSGCGGGGGGASGTNGAAGAGGGGAGVMDAFYSGFAPGDVVTVTLCSGAGTGGAAGAAGTTGGTSTLTYATVQILQALGGTGGAGSTSSTVLALPGGNGGGTATPTGSLTVVSFQLGGSGGAIGFPNATQPFSGGGGSTLFGSGGRGSTTAGSCGPGSSGGGGSGSVRLGGTDTPGCDGGSAVALVKWVL